MKGTEALPAPGESKPPQPGSSPAGGEQAVSLSCSVPPSRLPEKSSVSNSHPNVLWQGCGEARPELKPFTRVLSLPLPIGESVGFCLFFPKLWYLRSHSDLLSEAMNIPGCRTCWWSMTNAVWAWSSYNPALHHPPEWDSIHLSGHPQNYPHWPWFKP